MQTVAQQTDNRLRTIQGMMANAVPNCGYDLQHACAAIGAIITPAVSGGMFALPNFTNRPSDEEAIAYARSMFVDGAYDDGDGWRCGTILSTVAKPNAEMGDAVDVTLTFDLMGEIDTTVWFENGKLYGEW